MNYCRTIITGLFVMLSVTFLAGGLQAQQLKIGFLNAELLLAYMPETKQNQTQLKTLKEQLEQQIRIKQDYFRQRVQEYQNQQALLTDEVKAEREKELQKLQNEIQSSAEEADLKLQQKSQELQTVVIDRLQKVIDKIAAQKGLDLVLQSQPILYFNKSIIMDLTEEVAIAVGIQITDE